jgi:hypothetical protein
MSPASPRPIDPIACPTAVSDRASSRPVAASAASATTGGSGAGSTSEIRQLAARRSTLPPEPPEGDDPTLAWLDAALAREVELDDPPEGLAWLDDEP